MAKAESNKRRKVVRENAAAQKNNLIEKTSNNLHFDEESIKQLSKDELIGHIEFYRAHKKQLGLTKEACTVKAKSYYTSHKSRWEVVFEAGKLYRTQIEASNRLPAIHPVNPEPALAELDDYEYSSDDDC
jgi:hypothetical protein